MSYGEFLRRSDEALRENDVEQYAPHVEAIASAALKHLIVLADAAFTPGKTGCLNVPQKPRAIRAVLQRMLACVEEGMRAVQYDTKTGSAGDPTAGGMIRPRGGAL